MKKIIVVLFVLFNFGAQAQDPSFSQFWMSSVYLNPANIGINDGLYLSAQSRNQWVEVVSKFNTYSLAASVSIAPLSGALGFIATSDAEGEGNIVTNQIGLAYAPNIFLIQNRLRASVGFQVDYATKEIKDFEKLVFSNQLDPVLGIIDPSGVTLVKDNDSYFPYHAGLALSGTLGNSYQHYIEGGMSLHNIGSPEISLLSTGHRLPSYLNIYLKSGLHFNKLDQEYLVELRPYFIYQTGFQNNYVDFNTMTFGVNSRFSVLDVGVGYRKSNPLLNFKKSDAVIFNFSFLFNSYKNPFIIGFSYDATVSSLTGRTGGTFEVALKFANRDLFLLQEKSKNSRRYAKKCSNFSSERARITGW